MQCRTRRMARLASQPRPRGPAVCLGVQERLLAGIRPRSRHQRRQLQRLVDQPVPVVHAGRRQLRRGGLRECPGAAAPGTGIPGVLYH